METRDHHLVEEGDRLTAEVAARTEEIHESKEALSRELRESNELRTSNKQLASATGQAIAASHAKSQFMANLTHEIRTPINGVLGMTELLLNTDLAPKQERFARTILESGEDLLSIINDILDFSKVEAGKLERVDHRPFSPRECVTRVAELLKGRAELKGLALSTECADDLPHTMLGDGQRLRQVLTNFVGNAIKFTEQGQIVIRTTVVQQSDDFRTLRFEVVDTGVGIAEHLHAYVFEGFSQADNSTTHQVGGAGLGLAISKHLVELMGGQIGLVSRPGVGSNFWLTVSGEVPRATTAADRDLRGLRALIIATTGASRAQLCHELTTWGGVGVGVPNLERALDTIRTDPAFHVVLIDTQNLDGRDSARTPSGVISSSRGGGRALISVRDSREDTKRDGSGLKACRIEGHEGSPVRLPLDRHCHARARFVV